jgi:hypothetical protein
VVVRVVGDSGARLAALAGRGGGVGALTDRGDGIRIRTPHALHRARFPASAADTV